MTPPEVGHSHRLPRSLLAMVIVCIIGLLAAVVLSFAYAQNVDARLGRLEQYVQGRGAFRDQEQRRLEEQMRRSTCDLLDQLPEGGLLVKPRQKYHCGPGTSRTPPAPPRAPQRDSRPGAGPPGTAAPTRSAAPAAPPRSSTPSSGPTTPPSQPATSTSLPLLRSICGALGACP